MWIIYIQSLLDRLESRCNYYAYADDVTLIAKIASKEEITEFDAVLQTLITWGQEYGMKWGAHKTQRMALRYPHCRAEDPPRITFGRKDIEVTEKMESLGVILNKGRVGYGHLTKIKNKLASIRTLVSHSSPR